MATILSSKKKGEKIIVQIASEYDEYLQLKGHLDKVHIFSENGAEIRTNISQRGRNAATKYFLIPRQLRKGFKFSNETVCQKLDLGDKVIFVYVVDKNKTAPSRREATLKKLEDRYGKRKMEVLN